MQKCLAIGRGVEILDQKNRAGRSTNPPPASLRVKIVFIISLQFVISTSCLKRHFTSFQNMFSIMSVSCMFVLKYSSNTVFINIYYNMLQCQKHSAK